MGVQHIVATKLANRLVMSPRTCREWGYTGVLHGRIINGETHFEGNEVAAFLQEGWQDCGGNENAPTLEDLLDRRVVLLDARDVYQQHGETLGIRSRSTFYRFIQNGGFGGYFSLQRKVRLLESSVNHVVAQRADLLTRQAAEWVAGCTHQVFLEFLRVGGVKAVQDHSNQRYYRVADLARALQTQRMLPAWITPQRWVRDVLSAQRAPMAMAEARRALGLSEVALHQAMDRHELLYITQLSGQRRISVLSVQKAFTLQPALSAKDLAHVFGGTPAEVSKWLLDNALCCPLHDHSRGLGYRRACVVAMVEDSPSKHISGTRWYASRKQSRKPLVQEETVRKRYGISHEEAEALATEGLLIGFCRPDGLWVFRDAMLRNLSVARVRAWARARQAA